MVSASRPFLWLSQWCAPGACEYSRRRATPKLGGVFERAPSKNSWLSECVTNLAGVGARAKRHGPPVFLALVELRTLRKSCSQRESGEYASERLADAGWNAGRGGHA